MQPVRVLLVDDEPLARRRLRSLMEDRPDVEVVGESGNGVDAVCRLRAGGVDLMFLDIQMPDLDGFGVVEEIGAENMPVVVFVTAFEEYALDAFEVSALDYLLKPFEDERFELALDRALRQIGERRSAQLGERLACLVEGRRSGTGAETGTGEEGPLKRFAVRKRGRIFLLPESEVEWLEAAGSYVRLHTVRGAAHLVRDTLKRLQTALDDSVFVRIHRSTIVRADRVRELEPLSHGEYALRLVGGARLRLSRSYRDRLRDLVDPEAPRNT